MNRFMFMSQLEQHLTGISVEEINDAIAYYNEYFDEAGPENEAKIIKELISPHHLAAQIKAESAIRGLNDEKSPPPMKKGISAIWLVLLGILALPIALPLVFGVIGVLIGMIAAAFGVIISLVVVEVVTFVTGVLITIFGVLTISVHLPTGLFYLGVGLLAIGFSLLLGLLIYALSKGLVHFIAWVMDGIRRKSRERIRSHKMRGGVPV